MTGTTTPAPTATAPARADRRPPSRTRAVVTICRADLARLIRDPVALFFIVVLPVVIIIVIGATIGNPSGAASLGVVDGDGSEASARLVDALTASELVDVRHYDSVAALDRDIRTQNVSGGVAIPAGYGSDLGAGRPVTVALRVDQKQGTGTGLSAIVSSVLDREGQAAAAARFAAEHTGGDPEALLATARDRLVDLATVPVEVTTVGEASLVSDNRYAYTAPSNLVLFVFINTITGAAALVESRQLGVTRRMLAAPVSVAAIVLGVGLTRLLIALVQSALILAVGGLIFGVRWGDPLGAASLVLVFSLLATGAGLLVGATARKPEQVPAIGIPVAIGLAMLGGCMWPLEIVPAGLRAVGHLTPHAWAMDAWISLGFEGGDVTTIAGDLLVLALVAAALIGLAAWRLRVALTS